MDTKYQDIHFKTKEDEFVMRLVEVKEIRFLEFAIEIDYEIAGNRKTIVFPKSAWSKLIID